MILADLLCAFLKVGFFAFGGAYGAIPLIRDVVLSYGWLSEERLTYWIAVSESTPGPIMVNLATCVGSQQAGIPGALVASAAVFRHDPAGHGLFQRRVSQPTFPIRLIRPETCRDRHRPRGRRQHDRS